MDVDALRPGFTYLLLERTDRSRNVDRFYYLAWQPTLLDVGAVVRIYGRKGGHRRVMAPELYPSLDEAWPAIRTSLRRWLRNGYRIVAPEEVVYAQQIRSVQEPTVEVQELQQLAIFGDVV